MAALFGRDDGVKITVKFKVYKFSNVHVCVIDPSPSYDSVLARQTNYLG